MKKQALAVALVVATVVAISAPGHKAAAAAADRRIDLYVITTTVNGSQPCARTRPGAMISIAGAVAAMVKEQVPFGYTVALKTYLPTPTPTVAQTPGPPVTPPPDVLAKYLRTTTPAYVAIATVCKEADVTNIAINGYAVNVVVGTRVQSGSLSGTFDGLESNTVAAWANMFGTQTPSPPPFVVVYPNVAFLPVGNDTGNIINARLLHNLPITLIATPGPMGPTVPPLPGATPASVAPTPPATRLAQCEASADRMLIIGRLAISSLSNDLTRTVVAGSALTWKVPLAPYYTSTGVIFGLLYNPNYAEVSADAYVCPSDGQHHIYQVGGLNQHIVGHRTTPSFGTNPFAQQRAVDSALVDLENQLDCIIAQELIKRNIKTKAQLIALNRYDPVASSFWCTDPNPRDFPRSAYFAHLDNDAVLIQPIDGLDTR